MTTSAPSTVQRPASVTVVVILMWINAIIEIIGGVLLMIGATSNSFVEGFDIGADSPGVNGTTLVVAGLFTIALGIVTILLANGLRNGSNGVRIFVTIVIVAQILFDVAELIWWGNRSVWTGLIGILIWLIILAMLWTSRASAFFHQSRA